MATDEPGPGSELPAPYRSPWRTLAESLGAVSADLRLGIRRLWRRNLEGELPSPGFWPAGLAAVFWPLLLALSMAAVLLLGRWGLGLRRPAPTPAPLQGADHSGPPALLSPVPSPGGDRIVQAPERPVENASGPGARAGSASAPEVAASVQPPPLRLDPLLDLFGQGDDAALLLMARPEPVASRLSLTLSPAGTALPDRQLLERAERWQQLARDAGYERLELRDPLGRLRGRSALVGSGMILLAPGSLP